MKYGIADTTNGIFEVHDTYEAAKAAHDHYVKEAIEFDMAYIDGSGLTVDQIDWKAREFFHIIEVDDKE